MRKEFVFLTMLLFYLLLSCGGGVQIQMPSEGVLISYSKSVGKSLNYRTRVDKYIQASQQGASTTRLVKGDVFFSIDVAKAKDEGAFMMTYKFSDVSVGVFLNNQLTGSEEVDAMKGLEIKVTLDSTGNAIDIEGLDLQEELQKEEISPLEFLFNFPIPQEKVTIGYSWHDEKDTVIENEDSKVSQKVVQDYLVSDFIMLDSVRTVVCKLSGKVNIHQQGQNEQGGRTYDVDITMSGDIRGEVYFDIDNGRILKYVSNKMIDIKGHQIDSETGEKEPIVYYTQEKFDTRLMKKK